MTNHFVWSFFIFSSNDDFFLTHTSCSAFWRLIRRLVRLATSKEERRACYSLKERGRERERRHSTTGFLLPKGRKRRRQRNDWSKLVVCFLSAGRRWANFVWQSLLGSMDDAGEERGGGQGHYKTLFRRTRASTQPPSTFCFFVA